MSRLKDLYNAIETLRKEGVSTSDLEYKVGKAEEEIIQNEILPMLTETIAPALKQVQRELVLVVDYKPDSPISVHLSRKRNITDVISDAVEIRPDPVVTHKVGPVRENVKNRMPKSGLCVNYPNGEILQLDKACDTFAEFVRRTGYMRVHALGISLDGFNLVSNTKDPKYGSQQHEVERGWYVNVHSNTATKVRLITKISQALHLGVRAYVVE